MAKDSSIGFRKHIKPQLSLLDVSVASLHPQIPINRFYDSNVGKALKAVPLNQCHNTIQNMRYNLPILATAALAFFVPDVSATPLNLDKRVAPPHGFNMYVRLSSQQRLNWHISAVNGTGCPAGSVYYALAGTFIMYYNVFSHQNRSFTQPNN
jgi:hypothetical protein